ncbi:MAG: Fe-S cluster assembly protein SufD [Bacteroidota bacterium]|nr:Fe-S cluster assembly protein SufD [Bacteroidota bacterium]MDX5504989.1 Fe-S cluster assembly protein SufD [Bacteroidota bacterium]
MLSSFIVFENDLNGEARTPLHKIRQEALSTFEKKGFPTKRDEEWKYTNLRPVLKHDYRVLPKTEDSLEYKDVKRFFLNDADTYKVVFINGVYSSWLSDTTHQHYDICTFGSALTKFRDVVDRYFATIAPKDEPMVALNTAFAREGAFIRIPCGQVVSKPVEVVFFNTHPSAEIMLQPRNLIVVEENAQVQIIERHQNLSEHPVLTNVVSEVFAGRNAKVDMYKVQNDVLHSNLIDNTHIAQEATSRVDIRTFSFGGNVTRNNLNFYLNEEGAESHMHGITIIGDTQHVDHHTLADHRVPHCMSNELYKGIYDDRSQGVFNGKIIVHQDAQKTNAFQQNNNILLSEKASVDTKPQLEIFADDVKCSHGCTVGQLDDEALFYLQSRGIPKREGEALLMYAFSNEILETVRIPELRKKLNIQIAKKLGVDIDFDL